ncbi:flagellar hook-length control protein FliK, partial [Sphingomonas sp. AOB5]|uniref:flagellar hook-length control protein FliK n=1 Tax=Sphingomonas sp. AOB5 TaxID=3034017 RepID=UPI0023FA01C7
RVQAPLAAALERVETAQPALAQQLFAEIEAPGTRRQAPRDIALSAMAQALHTDAPRPNIVQAVAAAQQPVIDTSRQQWMAEMIETVSALRETPNSRETTIRLSPDALGTVDVSIRQEGDRVHVRIVAETAAARQLLNEAQPRLMELAEARGLRLGQTSVDTGVGGGTAGQGHQRQEQQAPATPLHNRTAPAADTATDTDANRRVA